MTKKESVNGSSIVLQDGAEEWEATNKKINRTSAVLTRYERAKLLGMRTEQIARGSVPMIDMESFVADRGEDAMWSSAEIALEEMLQKKTPFIIVRYLPDDTREYWRIKDMVVSH
jgi:DNA-directed RNA polymerase subunit K/omega